MAADATVHSNPHALLLEVVPGGPARNAACTCVGRRYGGGLVIRGEMTLAALTSFLLYTIMIAACLGGLSDLFSSMMNALGACQKDMEACVRTFR
eukprot:3161662-Pleurochrysis_carterae.AAC.1